MDDNIIILTNAGRWSTTSWKMVINLEEVVKCAGKRVKDKYNGGSFVDYPLTRARKLIQLIAEYGTKEDFWKCDFWFRKHPKLWEYWTKIMGDRT